MNMVDDKRACPKLDKVDVLIVGGGIAGCATAIALARHAPELTVAVCEKSQPVGSRTTDLDLTASGFDRPEKIGETLPPATVVPLQQLGLWESFRRCNFLPAHGTVALWGNDQPTHNEYMLSPFNHGWHIDRREFERWLQQEAAASGAQMIYGATVQSLQKSRDQWQFLLANSSERSALINAPQASCFVVDASGRRARVATALGIKKQVEDSLLAIFGFFAVADGGAVDRYRFDSCRDPSGNDPSTYIESCPEGWWYSAQLPDRRMVVAALTDADIAKKQRWSRIDQWLHALVRTDYTRVRTSGRPRPPALQRVCAQTQTLESVAGEGWLAVGDAASCYDPLSSLGIFKALRMSLYAAFSVTDTVRDNSLEATQKYNLVHRQEWRAYLQKRREYYQQEQRFCGHAFWQRRQQSVLQTAV